MWIGQHDKCCTNDELRNIYITHSPFPLKVRTHAHKHTHTAVVAAAVITEKFALSKSLTSQTQ